jgi:hypothetical protein
MSTTATRDTGLAEFDAAGSAFRGALEAAPEASLSYLKEGDDFALGGLVFHINVVLVHYGNTLDAIVASGFAETSPDDPPGLFEEAEARGRSSMTASERTESLAQTSALHAQVRARVTALTAGDYGRQAPVRYRAGDDPYPTSPAEVLGWLSAHYREHVPHIQQLLDGWRGGK